MAGETVARLKETQDVFNHIFHSSLSLAKLRDAALGGRLLRQSEDEGARVPGRSIAWKVFLTPEDPLKPRIDLSITSFLESWRGYRRQYSDLLLKHLRAPDGSYEEKLVIPGMTGSPKRSGVNGDLDKNNPLSLDQENPWKEWFASMELRKTIQQDVERTFPDLDYFRDVEVQYQLTNILFIYSVTHPDIGYRQGMHELLAPLYYAVDYDSVNVASGGDTDKALADVCDKTWQAADAWRLFVSVMEGAGRWYEWRESLTTAASFSKIPAHVDLNTKDIQPLQPYVTPIVQACHNIQFNLLKSVDPELWKALHSSGIEPTIYGMRMLRLLFTREFTLPDAMVLWDGLFAVDHTLDLAQWVCVAMLIRIRNKLIPASDNEQLMCLLRYPPLPPQSASDPSSSRHHTTILLQQALALQMCPTPATGAAMVQENRNFLHIPAEVPEPEPARPQRRGPRGRSGSDMPVHRSDGNASAPRAGHSRQQSSQVALESIARGLLDRGEALGINKTLMNAVTEIKRNLPELAASLVRTPPASSTSFTDFPLTDERPPEERPPWEPRTRFEMEREISQLRSTQKKLGVSVAWIVDTLLQDEDNRAEDDLKSVQERKREALECLAYVRDVLTSGATFVEEERLVGEEEFKRRKAKAQEEPPPESSARTAQEPLPVVTLPRPVAPPVPPSNESRPRPYHSGTADGLAPSRSPPSARFARSPSPPVVRSPPPSRSSPATPMVLAPNTSGMPMAPWNYTKSSFSEPASHIATLPRPPPRVSTVSPSNYIAPSRPPVPDPPQVVSPTQGERREVQQDPLGALS
ncbi:RabGAP/TBC [Gloeophyllum trabeum ATCC 11539]|uniref:RabGAP/TBC n=1 Tax=Gloeophyllum trabeum (strain ATCC 11539 / FP-39264 / Madison 617) TaxID=670483 RepID=S7QHE6_GLOTA|nr:RabGAP/TBC [Gloeophyllum trabeum ATCC 11539]EPQ58582.1 RabGAP/TBC [Gloeophyllum trabeum ATCC 11539]